MIDLSPAARAHRIGSFTLDPDLKTRWLEALRSGRYIQGRGVLHEKGCYCAVGVLLDVIDPEAWERRDGDKGAYRWAGETPTFGSVGMLMSSGGILPPSVDQAISSQNDDRRWSFGQIATWIEAEL